MPFVILFLLREKRKEFASVPTNPSWLGLLPVSIGIFLYSVGELGGEYYISYLSIWTMIVGFCLLHVGWKKVKIIVFPLMMILTMLPIPGFFRLRLSFNLKLISSEFGVNLMRLLGMSAYRTGNVIDLGFTQLQVVDACSGLRYLFPIIILSLLIAYFFKASLWKRAIILFSSIPVVVIANSMRIAITGLLYEHFGPIVAKGFFHELAGWFMFTMALTFLAGERLILKKFSPERGNKEQSMDQGQGAAKSIQTNHKVSTYSNKLPTDENFPKPFTQPQFLVVVALLGLTWGFTHLIDFRKNIALTRPLSTFPLRIGNWQGTRHTMDQHFIDVLDLSDYALIDYKDPDGRLINFYVAYYASQRKGESIHSPTTCLTGSGWIFKNRSERTIRLGKGAGERYLKVNTALIKQIDQRQLTYYWFPMRGRDLTNAYQMKIYNFWDALTKHRTDGALVRLITPLAPDESPVDADRRLEDFLKQLIPVLNQYLPGKDAGSHMRTKMAGAVRNKLKNP